jgi:hypothetical protein
MPAAAACGVERLRVLVEDLRAREDSLHLRTFEVELSALEESEDACERI